MTKYGYEVYDINITFKEDENNAEDLLDKALSAIRYDFDNVNIETDDDGYPAAQLTVRMDCSRYHKDAYWDDYGGGPAEDEIKYSGMEPDELENYLKHELNAVYVSMDYREFVED